MVTLKELLDRTLPLNRKERYYTGTVLPALLSVDDMGHLSRLGDLLGLKQPLEARADPDDCTVVFFTEYGIAESVGVLTPQARHRFAGLPTERDTPDVVILVTQPSPVLIALEAKLYDRPSRPEMVTQLDRQRALLEPLTVRLAAWLEVPAVNLVHAALLPEQQRVSLQAAGPLPVPVITWQDVLEAYADVAPRYWHAMLAAALDRYDTLVSRWTGYQDNELPGRVLVERWQAGDTAYPWIGRQGGLLGPKATDEIETGAWATTVYQCRREGLPGNPNWFAVADLIPLLAARGQLPAPDKPTRDDPAST